MEILFRSEIKFLIFTVDWIKGNLIGTASDRETKFFGGRRGFLVQEERH